MSTSGRSKQEYWNIVIRAGLRRYKQEICRWRFTRAKVCTSHVMCHMTMDLKHATAAFAVRCSSRRGGGSPLGSTSEKGRSHAYLPDKGSSWYSPREAHGTQQEKTCRTRYSVQSAHDTNPDGHGHEACSTLIVLSTVLDALGVQWRGVQ